MELFLEKMQKFVCVFYETRQESHTLTLNLGPPLLKIFD